ncbi:unnamed protein product [Thelazia callipaeda]|uniref:BHLH domain-containing protein n=1 Tax=Thelazia callipaeda TaxID=103827 RepID=A0A0N5CSY2_THECL|nr:unnamed protein product [Thelazia callipaeda]
MSTTTSPKSLSTPQNAALATGYSRLYLSTAEKRIRNRSLCSLLWTPPLYPGYSAKLEKSSKQKISLLPVENEEINWSSPKKETNSKESSGYGSGASESDPENDHHSKKVPTDIDNIDIGAVNIISDNNQAADEDLRTSKRTQARQLRNRHVTIEKARRRSIPACLRDAFSDEIARVLEINGVLQYETDAVSFRK